MWSSVVDGIFHLRVGEVSGLSGVSIRASDIDIDIKTDKIFFIFLGHYSRPCDYHLWKPEYLLLSYRVHRLYGDLMQQ